MKKQNQSIQKIGSFFLECISFSTPRAIVFNLTTIICILAIIPTELISQKTIIPCIYKNFIIPNVLGLFNMTCPLTGVFTGCNCPACGLTRSVSRLLHFDIIGSIRYNIMGIPVVAVMLGLIGVNVRKILKSKSKNQEIPL
jgi:hypothetical protein